MAFSTDRQSVSQCYCRYTTDCRSTYRYVPVGYVICTTYDVYSQKEQSTYVRTRAVSLLLQSLHVYESRLNHGYTRDWTQLALFEFRRLPIYPYRYGTLRTHVHVYHTRNWLTFCLSYVQTVSTYSTETGKRRQYLYVRTYSVQAQVQRAAVQGVVVLLLLSLLLAAG